MIGAEICINWVPKSFPDSTLMDAGKLHAGTGIFMSTSHGSFCLESDGVMRIPNGARDASVNRIADSINEFDFRDADLGISVADSASGIKRRHLSRCSWYSLLLQRASCLFSFFDQRAFSSSEASS